MKTLVTGASGFIGGYLVSELLSAGHKVIGLDNFSKYGRVHRMHDDHPSYTFVEGDAKDVSLVRTLLHDCDNFVAAAAMIGGIAYFHKYPYDILSENERITAAAFDAAIGAYKQARLRRITVLSSSMVFENAATFPTPEGEERRCPPPTSAYGFQKLACEYFARSAFKQHGLPFTIVRPFNCVGIGEHNSIQRNGDVPGNVRMAMSHVLPDLIHKVLRGEDPLTILGDGGQVRHYTYGGDLARGIRMTMENDQALNNDFNLSTARATTVLELARLVWTKINGTRTFRYITEPPFETDVRKRSPDVSKAERVLGFKAIVDLDVVVDEVISWMRAHLK